MFKFTNKPPKFQGFKKPTPAPEPEKAPLFKPIDVTKYSGAGRKLATICNWTGKQVYNPDSEFHADKNKAQREQIFVLTELAAGYMNEGQSADRILDKIEQTILKIDANAEI